MLQVDESGQMVVGDPADAGKLLVCEKCGGPLRKDDWFSYIPVGNVWTHEEETACERERLTARRTA